MAWLKKAVKAGDIAITSAHKDGAILLVTPENIVATTTETLNNPAHYKNIGFANPLPACKQKLNELCSNSLDMEYISDDDVKNTVGISIIDSHTSKKLTQSTADKFKPGTP